MSFPELKKFLYSKKEINRAGQTLIDAPQNESALEILEYWRSLHAEMIGGDKTMKDDNPISVRVKRSVSIIEKLRRFPKMQLTRMQDIAGIRFVYAGHSLKSLEFQKLIVEANTVIPIIFSCVQKSVCNYIAQPKPSGYRAIHQVYERQKSENPLHNGLLFEFQIRTRLQHLWAMGVETVGMVYGHALKSSLGDPGWLEFFKLVSAAISHLENAPVLAEHADKTFTWIREKLQHMGTQGSYFTKLAAIKEVAQQHSTTDYAYWLLELNIKKGKTSIFGFHKDQLETAYEMYSAKERLPTCVRGETQVVLVSTQSYNDLRDAYPSYFLDITDFIKIIHEICTPPKSRM